MGTKKINDLISLVENSIEATEDNVKVLKHDVLKKNVHKLVEISALEKGEKALTARYLIRGAALDLGAIPASIHDLYIARGKGEVPSTFTVPAINLRVLSFDAAKVIFKVAKSMNAGALIFEIARSEMGYTDQRPSEYTSNILAAAIVEDFQGPVFIQGDHFQLSPSKYKDNPKQELQAVKDLIIESIHAGFYNIDVDASTLVDLSKDTVPEQQYLNISLSAELSSLIRDLEPANTTISIGGEIGEVGGHNSTEEELRAYVDGFNKMLGELKPGAAGLSKISIQTGTSHGGVVLPDGSIATVKVDFDTMKNLSHIAKKDYGMGGAVQHGASTLPQEAFGKFVEADACEVHLATNFQNIFYDHAPESLTKTIHAYLDKNHSNERKPDMTEDQFYYKSRKRAIGPFKAEIWALPTDVKEKITSAWEKQFQHLFTALAISDTSKYTKKFIKTEKSLPNLKSYLDMAEGVSEEDTSDLAD